MVIILPFSSSIKARFLLFIPLKINFLPSYISNAVTATPTKTVMRVAAVVEALPVKGTGEGVE